MIAVCTPSIDGRREWRDDYDRSDATIANLQIREIEGEIIPARQGWIGLKINRVAVVVVYE